MAKRKDLKRDINFVIFEVVEEAYDRMFRNSNAKKEDQYLDIIKELVALRTDLLKRVSKKPDGVGAKKYFKSISEDLGQNVIGIVDKLNNLK